MYEPYPNPFHTSVTINYQIPEEQVLTLVVQNALGDVIKNLVSKKHAAGLYRYTWDRKNKAGEKVEYGFYFITLIADSFLSSKVLIKE